MFKKIDLSSKKKIDKYLKMVNYEACEYNFTTLYMWKKLYNLKYYQDENFILVRGEENGNYFFLQPLTDSENIDKAMEFVFNYFKSENSPVNMRIITKDFKDYLEYRYPEEFRFIEDRNSFDYIYEGNSLRTLSGKKNSKKRNHLNFFLKEYEGRYEYKLLSEENFDECKELMNIWMSDKANDEQISIETEAVYSIFENYEELKNNIKICGVYIDNKLQSFSIGEMLTDNMVLIHIEKANSDVRGLYQYINQQFLVNEYDEVDFVNREDDLGIKGLRQAKMSYHPIKFIEKYIALESCS